LRTYFLSLHTKQLKRRSSVGTSMIVLANNKHVSLRSIVTLFTTSRPGHVRCNETLFGHHMAPGRCHKIHNNTTKHRVGAVRCPDGCRWHRVILIAFKIVPWPPDSKKTQCRCHFVLKIPTKYSTGPGNLYWYLNFYRLLTICENLTFSRMNVPAAGRAPCGRGNIVRCRIK